MDYKPEYLYLTTTGWKTGTAREIEIWYVAHEGRFYLCAEHHDATHWVRNIRANPAITFYVGGARYSGTGRPLDPQTDAALHQAVAALFDAKYAWSDGLLVELTPLQPATE